MAGWDEFLDAATTGGKVASRKKGGKVSTKPSKLSASKAAIERAAATPPKGLVSQAWDGLLNNASSLFRPASVLGRQVMDIGDEQRTTKAMQAYKTAGEGYSNSRARQFVRGIPGVGAAVDALANLPNIDKNVAPVAGAARNAWSQLFSGTNADDGDLSAILGERGAAKWAPIQQSIDDVRRLKEGDQRSTVQRVADATLGPAAMFFNPDVAGVEGAAEDAGMGPLASMAASLLNPLEWLNAPGKGARAVTATAGKFGKARRLLNEAGALTDVVQTTLDYGAPLAKKAMDWKLPGRAPKEAPGKVQMDPSNFAERAGVDEAELAAARAEIERADAARFGSDDDALRAVREFAGLDPDGAIDDVDAALNGVRDFAGLRPDGSMPASLGDELDAVREFAGVRQADEVADPWQELLGVREFAGLRPDGALDDVAADVARAREFAGVADDVAAPVADDAADIARVRDFAGVPEDPDALLRAREFAGVADLAPAPRIDESAADIARAQEFAGINPRVEIPPIQGAIDETMPAPPAAPATRATQVAEEVVDDGGWREFLRGLDESVAPVAPRPGIAGAESAADVAAGVVDTGRTGLVRLSSNPLDLAWKSLQDANKKIGAAMQSVEGKVNKGIADFVAASPALKRADEAFGRMFRENYGVVARDASDALADAALAKNSIIRTSWESVAPALEAAQTMGHREALMDYMGRKTSRAQARALGLTDDLLDAGDNVRALMDVKSDALVAETLQLDRQFLTTASNEGKELIRSLVESYRKPANRVNTLKAAQQYASSGGSYDVAFVNKATNLIDASMSRMAKEGLLDAEGNIIDMKLPLAAWLKNRGTYAPQLYKFFEYGIDHTDPKNVRYLVDAIENRSQQLAAAAGVAHKPIPADVKNYVIGAYSGGGTSSAATRSEAARLMKRKDLSDEMRELLAPLADPGYVYAKGVQQVQLLQNTLRTRRWAAKQDGYVSRPGEDIEAFKARTGFQTDDIAQEFATDPMYASRAGALQGRYVHRDFADMLASSDIIPHLGGPDALDYLKTASRSWLTLSKVILNPASHARQLMQNIVSTYSVAGARGMGDYVSAIKEFKAGAGDYATARNAGLFSAGHDPSLYSRLGDVDEFAEFTFNQAGDVIGKMARLSQWAGAHLDNAIGSKAGKAFSASDDVAKLALFKHFRREGYSVADAVKNVQKELYIGTRNTRYEKLMSGQSVRKTMYDRGAARPGSFLAEGAGLVVQQPFFGAARFIWEQAWRNAMGVRTGSWMPMTDPARMARTISLIGAVYGLNEAAKHMNGISDEDERNARPDYMRPLTPSYAMLPTQLAQLIASDGSHAWWDPSSYHPVTSVTQGSWDVRSDKMSGLGSNLRNTFIPGAGAFSKLTGDGAPIPLNPALKPFVEWATNRDSFSGAQIYPEQMGVGAMVRPTAAHMWRSYMPPWVPNPLGLAEAMHAAPAKPGDKVGIEDVVRSAMQGLAQDSGHQASKLAAGVVNSWDYWWNQHGDDIAASRRIVDYRGREQYFGKAMLDAAGIRIETRAQNEMQLARGRRKKAIIADINKEYGNAMRNMRGPQLQKMMKEKNEAIRIVAQGKPDPRWYDESPHDTIVNWFNAVRGGDARGATMRRQDYY